MCYVGEFDAEGAIGVTSPLRGTIDAGQNYRATRNLGVDEALPEHYFFFANVSQYQTECIKM